MRQQLPSTVQRWFDSSLIDDWLIMARIGKPVRAFSMDFAKETHFPAFPCIRVAGKYFRIFVDAMLRGSACRL